MVLFSYNIKIFYHLTWNYGKNLHFTLTPCRKYALYFDYSAIARIFMKKIILALTIVSLSINICFASTKTVKKYDRYGRLETTYKTNGDTTKKYNRYGQYTGSYRKSGNKVKSYDKYNRFEGEYRE
jgi:hypothetical protein